MKKLFSLFLIGTLIASYAQERYSYVLIPRTFAGFKNQEDNPYGLSSNIHYLLAKRHIKTYYEGKERTMEDPCNGLKVVLKNTSSLFKNKLRFALENCNGTKVFSGEGTGLSKDFQKGYTEALQEALKELSQLPYKDESVEEFSRPASVQSPTEGIVGTGKQDEYQPKNLYFNTTYTFDLVEENGKKHLKIINGKLLGYKKLQTIAILSSSGIDNNTYSIKWYTPQGNIINGIAKFSGKELNISLSTVKGNKLIKVRKP